MRIERQPASGEWQHVATVPDRHGADAMACAVNLGLLASLEGEVASWRMLRQDGTLEQFWTAEGGWMGLTEPLPASVVALGSATS